MSTRRGRCHSATSNSRVQPLDVELLHNQQQQQASSWHITRENNNHMANYNYDCADNEMHQRRLRQLRRPLPSREHNDITDNYDDIKKNCDQSRVLKAVAITLALLSIAWSSYVGYIITVERLPCECRLHSGPTAKVISIDYDQVEENLRMQMKILREKISENKTHIPFDVSCGTKTAQQCQTDMDIYKFDHKKGIPEWIDQIEDLRQHVATIKRTLEQLVDKKTRKIDADLSEAKIELEDIANASQAIPARQLPQCAWKMKSKNTSDSFINISVPQKSETGQITIATTCSTTVPEGSVTKFVDIKANIPQFTCHCQNRNQHENYIDCIAHYWQCDIVLKQSIISY